MDVLFWSLLAVLAGWFVVLLIEDLRGSQVDGIHDALTSRDGENDASDPSARVMA